jgi:hypothetical protein
MSALLFFIFFCLIEERSFFWFPRTFVLPHTRRRWAFCAWGFGGGLAAALCSMQCFLFSFFLKPNCASVNIQFGFFCQNLIFGYPSVFCRFSLLFVKYYLYFRQKSSENSLLISSSLIKICLQIPPSAFL